MTRQLTPDEAARYYDWMGKGLDTQSFYEDPAMEELIAHGDFGHAQAVVDFACGTGRLGERLLRDLLPETATFLGLDVSDRMVEISSARLAPFGERARVVKSVGEMVLPVEAAAVDRVIATYILDLLTEENAKRVIGEAHRALKPGGLLLLASLTDGQGPVSGTVCAIWKFLYRLNPMWTGGCRPIRLLPLLGPEWTVRHHRIRVSFGVPTEAVVAAKAA